MEEENEPPVTGGGGGGAGGSARRERRANRQAAHLGSGVREREITGHIMIKIFFCKIPGRDGSNWADIRLWCSSGYRIYGQLSSRNPNVGLRYLVDRILNLKPW